MENIDIITIAKDENPYLNEWINHYVNLNINHIYIFDDNSNISFKKTIEILDEEIQKNYNIYN